MEACRIQWRKKNADGCFSEITNNVNLNPAAQNAQKAVDAAGDRLESEQVHAVGDFVVSKMNM